MDPRIQTILAREQERQEKFINLIASENFSSNDVQALSGSIFTNKYAEGLPGKRYYNGCQFMDDIEMLAIDGATSLFGCQYANVQPHSGANANLAVFKAFLRPGDKVLSMDLSNGGHLSHGSPANISGAWFDVAHYFLNENEVIDYDRLSQLAHSHRPRMIIAGASSYSRIIDWQKIKEIADSVDALLLADISHYSGLIAGDAYPSPFPWADVVTTTTHKTLRGPRGGLILWNKASLTSMINSAVFPGTQGGPLMHVIAAKAQCFAEAMTPEFREYARNVVANAAAMVEVFKQNNVKVVSNGTDCHMFTLDLGAEKYSGRELANKLEAEKIIVNKNAVPGDLRSFVETSGIRIGTAAETTRRGLDTEWFKTLAQQIVNILRS